MEVFYIKLPYLATACPSYLESNKSKIKVKTKVEKVGIIQGQKPYLHKRTEYDTVSMLEIYEQDRMEQKSTQGSSTLP
jgi:hypothetical protein